MRQISLTLLTSLLVFLALPAVAGKLYQWTDENGEKYYSDRVPPEHARREHRRLNPQGIEIERREPAKTPEQLAREQELKQLRAEQQRILEEQRARDRVLLRTFRTEDDLLMARNGKLVAVDAQIKLADSNVKRLRTRLADLQARAAALERRGDAVNRNLLQNIDQLRDQIENNYRYIVTREQDKLAIRERFEQDLQRFRQVQSLRAGETAALEQWEPTQAVVETLIACEGAAECDRFWGRAKAFAKRYATMPVQMSSERIYMTSEPLGNQDIGVTVSRLAAGDSAENIFLDVQCRNNSFGEELCNGPRVKQILESFRGEVISGS